MMTLSIGIAAYNEAANIGRLLEALLHQNIGPASLQKIVVVSDASTDGTDDIVSSIRDPRITLIRHKTRMGACRAQETIRAHATSDILVFLDADTLPGDPGCIDALIAPLVTDASVGLTSMSIEPLPGKTFIERVLAASHRFKRRLFSAIRGGSNLYTCFGPARAFSRALYEQVTFPDDVPIDALSYLLCIKQGLRFVPIPEPKVFFRCPSAFADHLKQSARFASGKRAIIKRFGREAEEAYAIPTLTSLAYAAREFVLHPILFGGFLILSFYVQRHQQKAFSSLWDIAISSKKLT